MQHAPQNVDGSLPRVRSGATLEAAAKVLTCSAFDKAIVTDARDRPIGMITLKLLTASLSSEAEAVSGGVPAKVTAGAK
jgi:glycine betaine/proline transport system ATP-binding protein